MKREDAKRLLPLIQEYAEGRIVQIKNFDGTWSDASDDVAFCNLPDDYRIKPESEYRPYRDCDEMIKDYCEKFNLVPSPYTMPMIWVMFKDRNYKHLIRGFCNCSVCINVTWYSFDELLEQCTYLDGTPCGIKE